VPKAALLRTVLACASLAVLGTTQLACQPASDLRVTAREDLLGLTSRLVFSTAHGVDTGTRAATLTNTGNSTIRVTGLTITGQQANEFKLPAGQARSFSIAPHRSATVEARFTPTTNGLKFATLIVANSSATPRYEIRLRGVSANGTIGNTEPQLASLIRLFGYQTDVGFTAGYQATTRGTYGDEVVNPYFVRADASRPVRVTPIARYTGASYGNGHSGRTVNNSSTKQLMYRFAPDEFVDENEGDGVDSSIYAENQKTFPTATGTFTFNPSAPFGIYGNHSVYTDDRFNRGSNGAIYRNIRVYPAKGENGARIANTWILAVDVNTDGADKNYDYQDQVILLTNAKPRP
jgi:centrosomal CEP192-like protein